MAEIQSVGVVGAGTMGSGIAHVFARAGIRVLLCDIDQRFLDRALQQIAPPGARQSKASWPRLRLKPALARNSDTCDREPLSARSWS